MGSGSAYSFTTSVFAPPSGAGSPSSFVRGPILGPGAGAPASFTVGIAPASRGSATLRFARMLGTRSAGSPTVRFTRAFSRRLAGSASLRFERAVPPPEQTYTGSTGDALVVVEPPQGFSGPTDGSLATLEPPQGFSGPTGNETSLPASQIYGGPTEGTTPFFPPVRNFGAATGGVVTGLPSPINLTATAIDAGCIRLDWVDPGPEEDGYRIERSLEGADDWEVIGTVDADVVTFLDRFAVPLVVYDYRVISFDFEKESLPSNIATAVTGLPPKIPTGPPPASPDDPQRNRIQPKPFDFLSPGVYGLEKDEDGDVTGFKF